MNRQLRGKPPFRRLDINAEQILNPRQALLHPYRNQDPQDRRGAAAPGVEYFISR